MKKKRLLKVSGWILFINAFFPSENWKITIFISPIKKTDVKPQNHKVIYKSSEKSSHQWAAVNKKYPRLLLLHTSFWSSGFLFFLLHLFPANQPFTVNLTKNTTISHCLILSWCPASPAVLTSAFSFGTCTAPCSLNEALSNLIQRRVSIITHSLLALCPTLQLPASPINCS